jgi:hypothetical protein
VTFGGEDYTPRYGGSNVVLAREEAEAPTGIEPVYTALQAAA